VPTLFNAALADSIKMGILRPLYRMLGKMYLTEFGVYQFQILKYLVSKVKRELLFFSRFHFFVTAVSMEASHAGLLLP
jgi:hypothetical protein